MRWKSWSPPDNPRWYIEWPILIITVPLWAPLVAALFLTVVISDWLERTFGPKKKWSRWFAWRPVRIDEGFGDYVWLENIERCKHPVFQKTVYRLTALIEKEG